MEGMTTMNREYGQRSCLTCGKEFTALYPAQITCSDTCRDRRSREAERIRGRARRQRLKKHLADLTGRILELEAEVARLKNAGNEDLEHVRSELARVERERDEALRELALLRKLFDERKACDGNASAMRAQCDGNAPATRPEAVEAGRMETPESSAVDTSTLNLMECKRMHVKATSLPCGERKECLNPPCEKLYIPEPGDKICPVCKKPFTPRHSRQKYCSKECQKNKILSEKGK